MSKAVFFVCVLLLCAGVHSTERPAEQLHQWIQPPQTVHFTLLGHVHQLDINTGDEIATKVLAHLSQAGLEATQEQLDEAVIEIVFQDADVKAQEDHDLYVATNKLISQPIPVSVPPLEPATPLKHVTPFTRPEPIFRPTEYQLTASGAIYQHTAAFLLYDETATNFTSPASGPRFGYQFWVNQRPVMEVDVHSTGRSFDEVHALVDLVRAAAADNANWFDSEVTGARRFLHGPSGARLGSLLCVGLEECELMRDSVIRLAAAAPVSVLSPSLVKLYYPVDGQNVYLHVDPESEDQDMMLPIVYDCVSLRNSADKVVLRTETVGSPVDFYLNCEESRANIRVANGHNGWARLLFTVVNQHTILTQQKALVNVLPARPRFKKSVISFTFGHDVSIVVSFDGNIQIALELERMFEKRYYWPQTIEGGDVGNVVDLQKAIGYVLEYTGMKDTIFDVGVYTDCAAELAPLIISLLPAKQWVTYSHAHSHASIGFYDSPFDKALIFTVDVTGFSVDYGTKDNGLETKYSDGLNVGYIYQTIGGLIPEVAGGDGVDFTKAIDVRHLMAICGKKMAYSALGSLREDWLPTVKDFYLHSGHHGKWGFLMELSTERSDYRYVNRPDLAIREALHIPEGRMDIKTARDLAYTSQLAFEEVMLQLVAEGIAKYPDVDGIVMSGGCSQNVKATERIRQLYGRDRVHVAAAPNDSGLGVGASWLAVPPPRNVFKQLGYLGAPLFDADQLPVFVQRYNAQRVTAEDVAELLAGGAIVGVLRGRQEFGPRALGHRSLMAFPDSMEVAARLNKIKKRQWYRPVAPVTTWEFSRTLFTAGEVESPYMSFAPALNMEIATLLPAITHYDNTSRVQTVTSEQEPWLHALLEAVGRRRNGLPVLCNTSFNTHGRPILNKIATALDLLNSGDGTDYVVVEDYLFAPLNSN